MSVTNVATADGDFSGKNLYTTGTANITINDVDVRFPNASTSSTVVAGGNVIVTNAGAINNAQMFSSGSGTITLTRSLAISASSFVGAGTTAVTIANNVTSINGSTIATRGSGGITVNKAISNSSLITNSASSNITINANVTNSKAVTNGSSANIVVTSGIVSGSALITNNADGNVTVQGGGSLSSTTVLSKDEFIFQSSSGITNSYIFANQNTIWKGSGDVSGGIIYSQADTYTQGTGGGNQQVGTSANPTLLIVGGDLFIQHTGTIDFNGLIFTNNTNYQGSGDFAINGSLISNGTTGSTVIQGSGNASINFRNDILTTLSANINSSLGRQLMRTPTCGTGGNKNTAMRNTKVTVF
jgi:hypothetical protein